MIEHYAFPKLLEVEGRGRLVVAGRVYRECGCECFVGVDAEGELCLWMGTCSEAHEAFGHWFIGREQIELHERPSPESVYTVVDRHLEEFFDDWEMSERVHA